MNYIEWLFGKVEYSTQVKKKRKETDFDIKKRVYGEPLPGRVSEPDHSNFLDMVKGEWDFVLPDFILETIPLIRRLAIYNEDFGQAIFDLVQLCNTGYQIKFDKTVKPDEVDRMRRHLYNKSKVWSDGVAGLNGLINKLIAQLFIGGAICNEWVISQDLTGVDNIFLIKPETIRWRYNKRKHRYEPYQKIINPKSPKDIYRKLNQFTFKYYGLIGDTELPYGVPPFIPALEGLKEQKTKDKNINHILEQLGILGYFEAKLEKPEQQKNENDNSYTKRLEKLLTATKHNLRDSFSEGIVVGFKDDHEFEFHSTTKNMGGVDELYTQGQIRIAKGLKHPPVFLGIKSDKSETHINIVFTKMLSQLKNVQNILKQNLEFGFQLELRLAGFKFDFLELEFEPSTITDELKIQQGKEIRIRNNVALYNQGIISQDTFADDMGFEAPDQKEPREIIDPNTPADPAKKKEDREKDKDKSDRSSRDKSKPQPKRKDQDTRER